ncbi:MAG: Maltose O-acetyltransferase [Syntrophorhabdus sp. PtaU1.Bin153]|nr:MAG: Maltose O-acetyltransferase [Syntrophorhabdus sp. PtaU1.Bin153]
MNRPWVKVLGVCLRALERALAWPAAIPFIVVGRLSILNGRYAETSLIVSKIPFRFGEFVRYFYYRATLQKIGKDVTFRYGSFCQYNNSQIGNQVLIGYYTALGEIQMGNSIVVGGFVNFLSGTAQHSYADPSKSIRSQAAAGRKTINIGSDVWIGSNAVIAANVGNRCVVGAGSVLVDEAEDHSVYAGNPARLIKKIPGSYSN